jgi:hypothetical protein
MVPAGTAKAAQLLKSCWAWAVFGMATPILRADCSAKFKSFWCSSMRKPGSKVRSIILSPWTSRILDAAKPPISACLTLAGSAPALAAKTSASPTASMFKATMIWLATLQVCPSPLASPTSVMFLPMAWSSGRTRSKAAFGPPHMMVRAAFFAPTSPPETGAST